MAKRPRDSAYSKFTNAVEMIAQRFATNATYFTSEMAAIAFLRKSTHLIRWKKYEAAGLVAPTPTNIIFDSHNHSCDVTVALPDDTIELGPGQRSKIHVLHVLAHHAAPEDKALHGPEFVKIFLDLVERYLGKDEKREAKDILISHGVKTRTVGSETRIKQRNAYMARQAPAAREKLLAILRELDDA